MSSPTAISPPRASSLVSPSAAAVIAAGGGALALEESETVNANVIPGARPTSRQGQNARERKLTGGAAGACIDDDDRARAPPSSFTLPPTFTPHPYNGPVNPDPLLVGRRSAGKLRVHDERVDERVPTSTTAAHTPTAPTARALTDAAAADSANAAVLAGRVRHVLQREHQRDAETSE